MYRKDVVSEICGGGGGGGGLFSVGLMLFNTDGFYSSCKLSSPSIFPSSQVESKTETVTLFIID